MMSKKTAAYLAGFIDGEGTLTITTGTVKGSTFYRPHLVISSTNREIIEWFKNSFGGWTRGGLNINNENWNELFRWTLHRENLLVPFLEKVKPYLKIKKRHAEILLQFVKLFDKKDYSYERRQNGTIVKKIISPEILSKRKELFEEIKKLNLRGKNH